MNPKNPGTETQYPYGYSQLNPYSGIFDKISLMITSLKFLKIAKFSKYEIFMNFTQLIFNIELIKILGTFLVTLDAVLVLALDRVAERLI